MRTTCLLLAASAASACTPHVEVVALADIEDSRLSVRVAADGREVIATLADLALIPCLVLEPGVVASLDGAPMEVLTRGDYIPPAATDAASSCDLPAFRLAADPDADVAPESRIEVSDDSTTLAVDLSRLIAVRRFDLAADVHPGAVATLTWSVETDVLDPRAGAVWEPDAGTGFALGAAFGEGGATVDDGSLELEIPANAPLGPGSFVFSALAAPAVLACEGARRCEVEPITPPPLASAITP